MAEEKTNKALDDITGIVDNMGKIVTNANTIFAQLAESLSKTGVSFDTLSSDMAGVMPNILEVITAYDSVKGAVAGDRRHRKGSGNSWKIRAGNVKSAGNFFGYWKQDRSFKR